ncbi:MAG: BolA family transcriptional regulator [Acidobacteriota bacterium]
MEKSDCAQKIENALLLELKARYVSVVDRSALHEGHAGAKDGAGHFEVVVVSDRFRGLSRVAAQRLVYQALADLLKNDIHALSMRTLTPEEWSNDEHLHMGDNG